MKVSEAEGSTEMAGNISRCEPDHCRGKSVTKVNSECDAEDFVTVRRAYGASIKSLLGWVWCYMPVIPAEWETEAGGS